MFLPTIAFIGGVFLIGFSFPENISEDQAIRIYLGVLVVAVSAFYAGKHDDEKENSIFK